MSKRNRMYDRINESLFDSATGADNFGGNNYDPDFDNDNFRGVTNDYDPDYAEGDVATQAATRTQNARPGQKMQINLTLSNPTGVKQKVELFNATNSWADVYNSEYVTGAWTCIPSLSTQGLATVGVGTVGYDQNGDLKKYGGMMDAAVTVGCGEYPYKSLVESTKVLPFMVNFLRIAVQTNAQLNNQIIHFTRTFAGGYKQNQINVRSYKKPTQFQNLEVDTRTPFEINNEKGLKYDLEAGEVVQIGMFINRWARPQV